MATNRFVSYLVGALVGGLVSIVVPTLAETLRLPISSRISVLIASTTLVLLGLAVGRTSASRRVVIAAITVLVTASIIGFFGANLLPRSGRLREIVLRIAYEPATYVLIGIWASAIWRSRRKESPANP